MGSVFGLGQVGFMGPGLLILKVGFIWGGVDKRNDEASPHHFSFISKLLHPLSEGRGVSNLMYIGI
jgi:hypothetical protein